MFSIFSEKFSAKHFAIAASLIISTSVWASGPGSTGGGNSVVCRDTNKQIVSAELLDLYEARSKGVTLLPIGSQNYLDAALSVAKNIDQGGAGIGFTVVEKQGDLVSDVALLSMFNPRAYLQNSVKQIDQHKIILPPGVGLSPINDSNGFILPENCKIEQLAEYKDANDQLYIIGDIWDHLDNLNKAALLVHEGLYQHLRADGETSSQSARIAVGLGFSDYQFEYVTEGIPADATMCWTADDSAAYQFAVYPKNGVAVVQFLSVAGNAMLCKTTLETNISFTPMDSGYPSYGNNTVAHLGPVNDDIKVGYAMTLNPNGTQQILIGTVNSGMDLSNLHKATCSKWTRCPVEAGNYPNSKCGT
jgi:hypothetical protein